MGERTKVLPADGKPVIQHPPESITKLHDCLPALVQPLGRVGQAGSEPVELLGALGQPAFELAADSPLELLQGGEQCLAIRTEDFGCSGGRWRTQVGGKIGNGEIGFVADTGNYWQRAGANGARDDFLVE